MLTMIGLRRLLFEANLEIIGELQYGEVSEETILGYKKLVPEVLFIINGEGTFHSNQPEALKILNATKRFAKDCLLLNSQWVDMSEEYMEQLSKFRIVQLRSARDYAQFDKKDNAIFAFDTLFYSNIIAPDNDIKFHQAVFTDSHDEKVTKDIWDTYRRIKNGYWYDFHYTGIEKKNRPQRYYEYINSFLPETNPKISTRRGKLTYNQLIRTFKNSVSITTGRYHAVCLAAYFGKTTIAFDTNTHKIAALIYDLSGITVERTQLRSGFEINFKKFKTDYDNLISERKALLLEKIRKC